MSFLSNELAWWITAFELPVMGGLFWMIWRTRQESEDAVDNLRNMLEHRSDQLRDALSAFKLEVAKTYASQTDLRELEARLTSHLLRIESKLDATALKAEAAHTKK
jgi:hypothetical protein